MKKPVLISISFLITLISLGQSAVKSMLRLPDTGETTSYTTTFGEDADYTINPPFFINNGDGTITDTVTGLMWQKKDGGEMTIENATIYCDTLTLGGYSDWRLPTAKEAFSINNLQYVNPALDTNVFTKNDAQYWWTSNRQANDSSYVWVTNAGGGIGNHPKSETVSAGGTKIFDVRAVRDRATPPIIPNHFTDNVDGTVTDNLTTLIWQKTPYVDTLTWEDALKYADTLSLTGKNDWRLPNIKELESINDESVINPSVNTTYFNSMGVNKFWSSTSLPNQTTKAWYLYTLYGITTYDFKTLRHYVMCCRGNQSITSVINKNAINELINIYPNPAANSINISSPLKSQIEIIDGGGRLIKSIITDNANTTIGISNLGKGIYVVKITTGKGVAVKKLVKE